MPAEQAHANDPQGEAPDGGAPTSGTPRPMDVPVVEAFPSPDRYIQWLAQHVAGNRFLPVPPPESHFVGDGDFRAIGAEFLRHFVQFGGLRPTDAVLEIGCGIGRMALPLTQYLSAELGRYEGVDVVRQGIRWCRRYLTPPYPNFRFRHLDLANGVYNPQGRMHCEGIRLPYESESFDFVILTSVVTHLRAEETRAYAGEIARLLRPAGRCFLSLFLITEAARAGLRGGICRLSFDPEATGPEFLADPANPAAAVAYEERFLLDLFGAAGLELARPVAYGHWSGGAAAAGALSFQDLCVLRRRGGGAP